MGYYLGIDLGGTNIAAGLVDEEHRIVQRESVKTNIPRSIEELCEDMERLCRQLTARQGLSLEEIPWVGVGSPGIIWGGVIYTANNLRLTNAPLVSILSRRTGRPAYLRSDGSSAAYGEYLAGCGVGRQSLVAMTIGTGVGSGVILQGQIQNGFNGAAAELGHLIIEKDGRACSCGRRGCFETYCSATGLKQSTILAMEAHPDSAMWELCGGDLDKASARTPFDAMRAGDPAAKAVVEEYLDYLAIGVANTINLLQPEVLCIGGGVSREGDALLVPLRKRVERLAFAGREGMRTQVVAAALGNDAGIIGAAMLGRLPEQGRKEL